MSSLNRAITLVQVDNIPEIISKQLNFNVLRAFKETLNEDGSVTEGRKSPIPQSTS